MVHREHLNLNASFDTGMTVAKTYFKDEPFSRPFVQKVPTLPTKEGAEDKEESASI